MYLLGVAVLEVRSAMYPSQALVYDKSPPANGLDSVSDLVMMMMMMICEANRPGHTIVLFDPQYR